MKRIVSNLKLHMNKEQKLRERCAKYAVKSHNTEYMIQSIPERAEEIYNYIMNGKG